MRSRLEPAHVPVLDAAGELVHREGVTGVPGLVALGLKFQRRRASHFIGRVGVDAAFIAGRLARMPRAGRGRRDVRGLQPVAHRLS